jgi:hypothetical protein
MRRALTLAGVAFICVAGLHAGDAGDPWVGKTREDLVLLLGEPGKTKTTDDGEHLTYKLVRLEKGAAPPFGMIVVSVPGVRGPVGIVTAPSRDGSDVTINPTQVDPRGRPMGGGVETDESYTVTRDSEGNEQRSWDDRSAIVGKLTLRFELGADGKIASWSVSPKKAAK